MIQYANDNDIILEVSYGEHSAFLVLTGVAKGHAYMKRFGSINGSVKNMDDLVEIPFDSLSEEIKEYYKEHKI